MGLHKKAPIVYHVPPKAQPDVLHAATGRAIETFLANFASFREKTAISPLFISGGIEMKSFHATVRREKNAWSQDDSGRNLSDTRHLDSS